MASLPSTLLYLLIGIAGWYYLFYSRAAHQLGTVEAVAANTRRIRLRRTNGAAMICLAAMLYIGTRAVAVEEHPRVFLAIWLGVFVLLLIVVLLALKDLRLTMGLRISRREDRNSEPK